MKSGKEIWYEPPAREPEEESELFCEHEDLYDALKQLTTRQAFVTRLYYGLDCEAMTQREIADLVGWAQSTVAEHLERARLRLYEVLRPIEKPYCDG